MKHKEFVALQRKKHTECLEDLLETFREAQVAGKTEQHSGEYCIYDKMKEIIMRFPATQRQELYEKYMAEVHY